MKYRERLTEGDARAFEALVASMVIWSQNEPKKLFSVAFAGKVIYACAKSTQLELRHAFDLFLDTNPHLDINLHGAKPVCEMKNATVWDHYKPLEKPSYSWNRLIEVGPMMNLEDSTLVLLWIRGLVIARVADTHGHNQINMEEGRKAILDLLQSHNNYALVPEEYVVTGFVQKEESTIACVQFAMVSLLRYKDLKLDILTLCEQWKKHFIEDMGDV